MTWKFKWMNKIIAAGTYWHVKMKYITKLCCACPAQPWSLLVNNESDYLHLHHTILQGRMDMPRINKGVGC